MKNLTRVRPEDFDVKMLKAAAREGRLYLDNRVAVGKETVKKEVRAYVARIKKFATREFNSSVDEVWEQILCDDDFIDYLKPGLKASLCCIFNKYSVMRIVCVLREHGVYEQYSDRKYDALFEPEVKDSPYRKYLGKGINEHYLLIKIRNFMCKMKI